MGNEYLSKNELATLIFLTREKQEKNSVPINAFIDGNDQYSEISSTLEQFVLHNFDKYFYVTYRGSSSNVSIKDFLRDFREVREDIEVVHELVNNIVIKTYETSKKELINYIDRYLESFKAGNLVDGSTHGFLNFKKTLPMLLDIIENHQNNYGNIMSGKNDNIFARHKEEQIRILELLLYLESKDYLSIYDCSFDGNLWFCYNVKLNRPIEEIKNVEKLITTAAKDKKSGKHWGEKRAIIVNIARDEYYNAPHKFKDNNGQLVAAKLARHIDENRHRWPELKETKSGEIPFGTGLDNIRDAISNAINKKEFCENSD